MEGLINNRGFYRMHTGGLAYRNLTVSTGFVRALLTVAERKLRYIVFSLRFPCHGQNTVKYSVFTVKSVCIAFTVNSGTTQNSRRLSTTS